MFSRSKPVANANNEAEANPLCFHKICGDNVRIERGGRTARRYESFCKGLAFSARPIAVNEVVCIKFTEVSVEWSGVLRFGVTNIDPASLRGDLPKFACPDLTSKDDSWGKALPERYCKQDALLHFVVLPNGDLNYGLDGSWKGLFLAGVNTCKPMYVLVDIYGNSTCVSFVDAARQNIRPLPPGRPQQPQSSSPQFPPQPLRVKVPPPPAFASANNNNYNAQANTYTTAPVPAPTSSSQSQPSASTSSSSVQQLGQTLKYNAGAVLQPITWHSCAYGRHLQLDRLRLLATRRPDEYSMGYVFTERPVNVNETLIVQVLSTMREFSGGLTFGVTCADPLNLRPESLPDDSDSLLDRPEYWISIKDVAAAPAAGTELAFKYDQHGRVLMYQDAAAPKTIFHVDPTVRLYFWFDVYGSTQALRLCGIVPSHVPYAPSAPATTQAATATASTSTQHSTPANQPNALPRSRSASQQQQQQQFLQHQQQQMQQQQQQLQQQQSCGIDSAEWNALRVSLSRPAQPPPPVMTGSMPLIPTPVAQQRVSAEAKPGRPPPPRPVAPVTAMPKAASQPTVGPVAAAAELDMCEADECTICMSAVVNSVLVPCGHMCMCHACAQQLHAKSNHCPVCRQNIVQVVRVYKAACS